MCLFLAALTDYSKDISVTTISSVYVGKGPPFPSEHVLTCICSEIVFLVKMNVYIKLNYRDENLMLYQLRELLRLLY